MRSTDQRNFPIVETALEWYRCSRRPSPLCTRQRQVPRCLGGGAPLPSSIAGPVFLLDGLGALSRQRSSTTGISIGPRGKNLHRHATEIRSLLVELSQHSVSHAAGTGTVKPNREKVLAAYADGVQAVEAIAARVTDWSAPTACREWQAVDLAGHLLAVVPYYHDLLDAAEAARPRTRLPIGPALVSMNARELLALPPSSGPNRIAIFLRLARHYGHRLAEADWHMTLGHWDRLGKMSLAQHTGLAIGEWHIHAWDLACSAGEDHHPADAATIAAGRSVLPGAPAEGDAWLATLIGSGRSPAVP